MAWNQSNFDDALANKYRNQNIMADSAATSAGADVTRANASMLNVQQQPGLHQMDNDAAMQRTQYSSDTQNQMNQRDNNTRMSGQNQNYALGQADLGLKAATAAAQDQRERAWMTRNTNTYDQNGNRTSTPGVNWSTVNTGPSWMDPYLKNNPVRGFGLQGFERGGVPPVNRPFVANEDGPERFIPADGSAPVALEGNGPTVTVVSKPGFVEPNPKTVAQQARTNLNQGQPAPAMSGVDAPWAGQSPRQSGLSPEGIVLPQAAPTPGPTVEERVRAKLGDPTPPRYVQVGNGKNTVTMRETNLYDEMQRMNEAEKLRAQDEAASKQDFDPAAAEGRMHNMTDDEAKAFKASLSPAQQKAIYDYTVQRDTMNRMMNASPRRTGAAFIQQDGRPVPRPTANTPQASSSPSSEYISEYSDGTRIVKPEGDVTVEPDAVQQSLRSFLANRQAAMNARGKEIDAENQDMRKRQAALARRALGLGSYFVTAPDTAIYR